MITTKKIGRRTEYTESVRHSCDHTILAASRRMRETIDAGFMPMAMVWRDSGGLRSDDWRRFQREWARPAIVGREIMERWRGDE